MTMIRAIIQPDAIFLSLEISGKKRLFEQVAAQVEKTTGIPCDETFGGLNAREKLGSTALGQGIAIPHARVKGLAAPTGVFIRLAEPIPFDAPDGKPVDMAFALLVPEAATQTHLEILSLLATLFSDSAVRQQLRAASTPESVHACLTGAPPA